VVFKDETFTPIEYNKARQNSGPPKQEIDEIFNYKYLSGDPPKNQHSYSLNLLANDHSENNSLTNSPLYQRDKYEKKSGAIVG
jgi:hypothetical protein